MATFGTARAVNTAPLIAAAFQQDRYVARQKILTLAPKFYFCDLEGQVLAFLRQKFFTWKDEIRVFTDETQSFELLSIKARRIVDWGTAFDVTDSINHQKVGAIQRRGWKSILRTEWTVLDAADREIGRIKEDSLALLRRFIKIIPCEYSFEVGGLEVGTAKQSWNVFAPKMAVDFSADPGKTLDRRLAAAAIVLLMAVEKRERSGN